MQTAISGKRGGGDALPVDEEGREDDAADDVEEEERGGERVALLGGPVAEALEEQDERRSVGARGRRQQAGDETGAGAQRRRDGRSGACGCVGTGARLERDRNEHPEADENLERLLLQRGEDEETADHAGHGRGEDQPQVAGPGLPRAPLGEEDQKAEERAGGEQDEDRVDGLKDGEGGGAEQQGKAKAGGRLQGRAGEGRDRDEGDLHGASVVFDLVAKGLGRLDEGAEGPRHVGRGRGRRSRRGRPRDRRRRAAGAGSRRRPH